MSKVRIGTRLEIAGRQYKVVQCDGAYRRCRICQEHNALIPCFNPDKTKPNEEWSQQICKERLPKSGYLKPL